MTHQEIYAYWNGLRGARAAPEQEHIDPAALRHLLPEIFILDIESGAGFPFRLAGTLVCDLFCRELRGRSFLDLFADAHRRQIRDAVGTVVADAAVAVGSVTGQAGRDRTVELELLLLPLRHKGRTHARLLGAIGPIQRPLWISSVPVNELSPGLIRLMWPSGRRAGLVGPEQRSESRTSRMRRLLRWRVFDGGKTAEDSAGLRDINRTTIGF